MERLERRSRRDEAERERVADENALRAWASMDMAAQSAERMNTYAGTRMRGARADANTNWRCAVQPVAYVMMIAPTSRSAPTSPGSHLTDPALSPKLVFILVLVIVFRT